MIVCKIMADFDSDGDFSGLFDSLSKLGAILCPDEAIFFASSLDPVDKKKVKRILKKNGYEDSVIVEYGVSNPPKETPVINGWVFDFITQNAIIRLGKDNRDAIREGIHQLDEIDALVAKELDALDKEQEEPGDDEASENITEE